MQLGNKPKDTLNKDLLINSDSEFKLSARTTDGVAIAKPIIVVIKRRKLFEA